MKIFSVSLGSLFSVLFLCSAHAEAKTLVKCNADMAFDGKTHSVSLVQNKGKYAVQVDGNSSPVLRVIETQLNTSKLFLCGMNNDDFDSCLSNYFGDLSFEQRIIPLDLLYMHSFLSPGNFPDDIAMPTKEYSFDLGKVTFARKYLTSEPSKFGSTGLLEFYDGNKELLGRALAHLEVAECK